MIHSFRDDHAHSTQDTPAARLAAAAGGCRGLRSVGHGRSPVAAGQPHDDSRNGRRALWLSGLAAHHPLCHLPLHDPAHPQRPADPRGPSAAVLERPLHPRHRVAPAHAGRGAQGPRLDGQGRLPLPLPLDRPARLPAHRRHGPALALPQRLVLGGQRPGLRGPAVLHRAVEAPGADVLADRARRLGRLRPLRHLPPAAGAKRLLPLQRPPATGVLRGRVRPGPAGDADRPVDVAGLHGPVHVVSDSCPATGKSAGRSTSSSCAPSSYSSLGT